MRHAVVNSSGVVLNVILCSSDFDPGEGLRVIPCDGAFVAVGWAFGDGVFFDPNAVVPEPETPQDQVGTETTPAAPEVTPPQTEPETTPAQLEPEGTTPQNDPANA